MSTERYLLGGDLLRGIRRTVQKSDGIPIAIDAQDASRQPLQQSREPQLFRVGTATGSWNKTYTNEVQWYLASGVTATFTATNIFANITGTTAAYNVCTARAGNTWYLIAAECT